MHLELPVPGPRGTRYIGIAGHCIGPGEGATGTPKEKVWPLGGGPSARDADGRRIGEFAYGALQSHGTGLAINYTKNFALIRLDPGVEASPEMCYFGGPRGLYATDTAGSLVLQYYGNGDPIGAVLPARSGVALGTPNPDSMGMTRLAPRLARASEALGVPLELVTAD